MSAVCIQHYFDQLTQSLSQLTFDSPSENYRTVLSDCAGLLRSINEDMENVGELLCKRPRNENSPCANTRQLSHSLQQTGELLETLGEKLLDLAQFRDEIVQKPAVVLFQVVTLPKTIPSVPKPLLGKHMLLSYEKDDFLCGAAAQFTKEGLDLGGTVRLSLNSHCENLIMQSLSNCGLDTKTLIDSGRFAVWSTATHFMFTPHCDRVQFIKSSWGDFVTQGVKRVFFFGDVPSVRQEKDSLSHTPEEFEDEVEKYEAAVNNLPYWGFATAVCCYNVLMHPSSFLSRVLHLHEAKVLF